jgi:hypothetical protein
MDFVEVLSYKKKSPVALGRSGGRRCILNDLLAQIVSFLGTFSAKMVNSNQNQSRKSILVKGIQILLKNGDFR